MANILIPTGYVTLLIAIARFLKKREDERHYKKISK